MWAAQDPFAAYLDSVDKRLSGMLRNSDERASATMGQHSNRTSEPNATAMTQSPYLAKFPLDGLESFPGSTLARFKRLRPVLEAILGEEGVPKELAAVVLVESAARPDALSQRQARGLWQLMPGTARQYGLRVEADHDERIDIEASAHAAARYLRDLYARFGDWPLALAAYNAGQDAVERAMDGSGASTFWQLSAWRKLPEETRNYVPTVLSVMQWLGFSQNAAPSSETSGLQRWIYASTQQPN